MSELDDFNFEDGEDRDNMHPNDAVEVYYDFLIYETVKAFLLKFGKSEVWIPKSQVSEHKVDASREQGGSVFIPAWLADAKGLDYEDEA